MDNPKRILIVDDDENIRLTYAEILKSEGYAVDEAKSGSQALAKFTKSVYNLALIDMRLPDMEGTELLKRIKEPNPKTRKIIITGFPTMQNAVESLNKNADAYIIKPVDVENLLRLIEDQLRQQEDERKFSEQKVADFIKTRVKELSSKQ